MRILHINYSDQIGGASIACSRLNRALRKLNINSNLLVAKKISNEKFIYSFNNKISKFKYNLKRIISRLIIKPYELINQSNYSISLFRSKLFDENKDIDPDIINLHWICNETISLRELNNFKKPIVWTLCDMWPFLGAEHNYFDFKKKKYWIDEKILFSKTFDINHFFLKKKIEQLHLDITIVAISNWIAEKARQSILFKNKKIVVIPCCLDFDKWAPKNKDVSKKNLNLNFDKKIILFMSSGNTIDKKKGFDYLLKAIDKLNDKDQYHLLIIGKIHKIHKKKINISFSEINKLFFGKDENLTEIYSAADLLIAPSLIEAFGQVALEAASCKLPTLAFNNTGVTEIILHKVNGYLANYRDVDDLSNGIKWCLDKKNYNYISDNAIEYAKKKFSYEVVSQKYINLYKSLINN